MPNDYDPSKPPGQASGYNDPLEMWGRRGWGESFSPTGGATGLRPDGLGYYQRAPINETYAQQMAFLQGQDPYMGYGKIGDPRFQKRYDGSQGQMWGGVRQQQAQMGALAARRGMAPGAARAAQYAGGELESRGWGMAKQLQAVEDQQRDRLMYEAMARRSAAEMEQQRGETQHLSDLAAARGRKQDLDDAEARGATRDAQQATATAAQVGGAVFSGAAQMGGDTDPKSDERAKKRAFRAGQRSVDALVGQLGDGSIAMGAAPNTAAMVPTSMGASRARAAGRTPAWVDAPAPRPGVPLVPDQNDQTIRNLRGYTYDYKDPNSIGAAPGRQYGVMAQQLERTPLGRMMLTNSPGGDLMIDQRAATGATLGMIGRLGQRVDELERRK